MTTKNISLKKSAYERLTSLKKEGESFSDLINRLTQRKAPKYADLSETLSKDTIRAIEQIREERKERDKTEIRKLSERFKGAEE